MGTKAGPFTFAELQTVTSLGRGEIRECVNRGIISAPIGVGQGNHRSYSKWNLVEGVIAAALLRHVRAGSVANAMKMLHAMLQYHHIDPEAYCKAPGAFEFEDLKWEFLPRTKPDDKANPPLDEETGENALLIVSARIGRQPQDRPPTIPDDNPLATFCHLPIDLERVVRFVDYMIEIRL
jgi:hypothetical protein